MQHPQPRKRLVRVQLSDDTWRDLRHTCIDQGVTAVQLVSAAIEQHLAQLHREQRAQQPPHPRVASTTPAS